MRERAVGRSGGWQRLPHDRLLYGGGPALTNSAGVPWTVAYIDTIEEPTADLHIAAVACEHCLRTAHNVIDDAGIKGVLSFLRTRKIAHQKILRESVALDSAQSQLPQDKLSGLPNLQAIITTCRKALSTQSWNSGGDWQFIEEPQPAVDGGDGLARAAVSDSDAQALQAMAKRTASDTSADPKTGADLGSGKAV
jgi:Mn-containing catalase